MSSAMNPELNNAHWVEQTSQYVAHTYGRFPVAMVRGEGCYLWDADGKRYLDFVAGLAVCNLGHAHPAVTEAIREQAGQLLHVSNLFHIPGQAALARKICENSFGDRVFFANSGAEAIEGALKVARKYGAEVGGGRFEIITTENSFHGRTYGAVSATGQEKYWQGFAPLLPGIRHVPYGDLEAMRSAMGEQTAAVLLEPIQGEGGVNMPPAGYLAAVRRMCDEHGVLLMLDEVQVGNGRTGALWAYEHEGITPDVMTLAKGLAGGMPIGALVMTNKVASVLTPGAHASTFGGNPLAMAAGLAAFEALSQPQLLRHVTDMGDYLTGRLVELSRRHPVIRAVRGRGLIVGAELAIAGAGIVRECLERGVIINCARDRVLRFLPPLIVTQEQIDEVLALLEDVLAEEVRRAQA
jgi:acetylornithine/N-succinyldiaminopimelate aminotransferase